MEGLNRVQKFLIFVFIWLALSVTVSAADFNVAPTGGSLGVNQEFTIHLRIDTKGEKINAAQATLSFPTQYLEVINLSLEHSVFNFWLQEPRFNNQNGTISFIGGTPAGISGESLDVLHMTFKTKSAAQSAAISYIDGAITIADGSGNNILENSNGANYLISTSQFTPSAPTPPTPTFPSTPVTRTPTKAVGLPALPQISIPLYPDQNKWYSRLASINITWDLLSDISGISTAFNNNPNFIPPPTSEGVFGNMTIPPIDADGVYFFHVRFRNNVGWGPTIHYKISVDTQPPEPPEVKVYPSSHSTDPTPTLEWVARDNLSGVYLCSIELNHASPFTVCRDDEISSIRIPKRLEVITKGIDFLNVRDKSSLSGDIITRVDPGDIFEYVDQENGWYNIILDENTRGWVFSELINDLFQQDFFALATIKELGPLEPGIYDIDVEIVDNAGNSISETVELQVIPIESPRIDFVKDSLIKNQDFFRIEGVSIPGYEVIINIRDNRDFRVIHEHVRVAVDGEWSFTSEQYLPKGDYYLEIRAENDEGALSLWSDRIAIKVKDKPILVIGDIGIAQRDLWIIAIIIIIIFFVVRHEDIKIVIKKKKKVSSKKGK